MFLIRSSTRGRGREGEGEIQFFPPIVPGNRDRKKKISSSPRRKETSFPTIQSDSSRLSRLLSIDRRRNRRIEGEIERDRVESIGGKKGERRRGKKWKGFRSTKSSLVLFFFAKPLLPLHSLSCCRFLSPDEWKRFAFYRASIQTRSNFARSPPLFPPFENLSNRRNRALSPPSRDTWRITPIVTRPLFSFSRSRNSYEDRDRWPSINKRRRGNRV